MNMLRNLETVSNEVIPCAENAMLAYAGHV